MDAAAITAAVTSILSIATTVITFISGNALCMLFVGASAVSVGFHIFRSAKNSAM